MNAQNKKRTAPISFRIPKGREEEFYERVAASGLSVNGFITKRVFGGRGNGHGNPQDFARLLSDVARIKDLLADAEAGDKADLLDSIHADMVQIRAALLTLMGMKP